MKFHEILQFFKYSHLPDNLQVMSKPFYLTAMTLAEYTPEQLEKEIMFIEDSQADSIFSILRSLIDTITPANPEATWAVVKIGEAARMLVNEPNDEGMKAVLRRLLEAKDCAVRSLIYVPLQN
jgi:hypothetical protein